MSTLRQIHFSRCQVIFISIGGGKVHFHGSLGEGSELKLGDREMEIDCPVSRADYLSGACFGRGTPFNPPIANSPGASKQFAPLKPNARAMAS